jgi:hypothetical protein
MNRDRASVNSVELSGETNRAHSPHSSRKKGDIPKDQGASGQCGLEHGQAERLVAGRKGIDGGSPHPEGHLPLTEHPLVLEVLGGGFLFPEPPAVPGHMDGPRHPGGDAVEEDDVFGLIPDPAGTEDVRAFW